MALGINTNIPSLNAQNQLGKSQGLANQALERLSSGLRINSAKDDAAGLAISTNIDAQVRGMTVAQRNTNDAISMVQTAEGAMDEIVNNLQRMRELAVQAANGSNDETSRALIQDEVAQRIEEINRIAEVTEFNGVKLLNANDNERTFQVGAETSGNDKISVTFANVTTANLGTTDAGGNIQADASVADIDVSGADETGASAAITIIDDALETVNSERSSLGAYQNRFESVLNTLATSIENASASQSRIMDADFAAETAKMAKANVLQQAGISVLAQANARPNQVLSLLQ